MYLNIDINTICTPFLNGLATLIEQAELNSNDIKSVVAEVCDTYTPQE